MQTPIFDFPIVEFLWYGLVSIMCLLCFTSLSWETARALEATAEQKHEAAREVVRATFNVNFAVMVVANICLMTACAGILMAGPNDWRPWFAGSIFICGAYWFYTRACERKLILFLQQVEVYPRSVRPSWFLKLFRRT